MNRMRGSVNRKTAAEIGDLLAAHGIEPYTPFWKGYRDITRELALMIRTNGLPLALTLAIVKAEIAEGAFPQPEAESEKIGRKRAVIDLVNRLAPASTPADLLAIVEGLTTADRASYTAKVDEALASLLWQKTLSAARAPRDDEADGDEAA